MLAFVFALAFAISWGVPALFMRFTEQAKALLAIAGTMALQAMGLTAGILSAFAPDLALVLAVVGILSFLPATLRTGAWIRRALVRGSGTGQP